VIQGQKISLRCLETEDLPLIMQWRNQQHVRRYFFQKALLSKADQLKWYERYLGDSEREIFIAESHEHGTPIGMIGLYQIDLLNRKAEIGSTIVGDRSMWGKGIAKEMLELLLEYSFVDLGMNRLYSYAIAENIGSIRAKQKCGFQLEGTLRQDHYANGTYHDVVLLSILRKEWEQTTESKR
jgi:RimJ/RimL family protein N-acetyltransferase